MTAVIAGLSSIEASRRLAADGPNQLPEPRRPSALRHFGKQFTHLLAILLWVASGLALLAGQPALALAIVVVIVLNAIFAFAQEYRADRSAERLRSLLPMSARYAGTVSCGSSTQPGWYAAILWSFDPGIGSAPI